ncbi:MAG: proton-conducting membrane transporter [Oscillospiraceae bacterium]|nr:proton-conducting membrane transporter [Oscillospiraceae bacterium]
MLFLPLLFPLAGGVCAFLIKKERARAFCVMAALILTLASAAALCLTAPEPVTLLAIGGGIELRLGLDGMGRFFILLMSAVWTVVAPFAFPYIRHEGHDRQFFGFYLLTLLSLMGLCVSRNAVTLYMFYELMTLLSVPLVLHNGTERARYAALKYLGYSVAGASLALFGLFLLYRHGGAGDFSAGGILTMAGGKQSLLVLAWFLMTLGFGCKAGMIPMQAWLTTAHPVAPAPASAVLSGIITKAGVLGIIRVTFFTFGTEMLVGTWAQKVLMILALLTVLTGSMLAYKEKHFKKRLAYSTVSQVSYALFGLLLLTPLGALGALLQVFFHAVAKDVLFLSAGAMIYRTGRENAAEYLGIGREMPVTTWCFAIGALSLIGIPPTGGYFSKWYLATSAIEHYGVLGIVGAGVLLLSALLTAGYLLPIVARGFFPGRDFIPQKREVGAAMLVPMILLALAALIPGLFSGLLAAPLSLLASSLFSF